MKTICFKGEFVIISLSIMVFLGTGNLYHAHAADKSAGEPGPSAGGKNPLWSKKCNTRLSTHPTLQSLL